MEGESLRPGTAAATLQRRVEVLSSVFAAAYLFGFLTLADAIAAAAAAVER